MESNEHTELTRKIGTDSSMEKDRDDYGGRVRAWVEGWSKKEKGLMAMDHRVVTAGGRECKGTKWEREEHNKDQSKACIAVI